MTAPASTPPAEPKQAQANKPAPKVSTGRIVHFVDDPDLPHKAAIVCSATNDAAGRVNLHIFSASGQDGGGVRHVEYDEKAERRSTWHWPERE